MMRGEFKCLSRVRMVLLDVVSVLDARGLMSWLDGWMMLGVVKAVVVWVQWIEGVESWIWSFCSIGCCVMDVGAGGVLYD